MPGQAPSALSIPAEVARPPVVAALRAVLRKPHATLVGAAIGTGMAAHAASRGGADFILALNAGRLRSMGAPSLFSLLALRQSNDFVLDFARSEILPFSSVPVFFGASAFDPRRDIEAELDRIAEAGFGGVVNFPSAIFLDGTFRDGIERAGVGFRRELVLLGAARARGLATLAYVRTMGEARAAAEQGVDLINLNLGWNVGGTSGCRSALSLPQAAEVAKLVFRSIRAIAPDTLCLLEGGPIVSPSQMHEVSATARADGYVGGSTIDRVPMEASIEHITHAFKSVGTLHRRIDDLERQLGRVQRRYAIVGRSEPMQGVKHLLEKLAATRLPVLITGGPGTGKKLVARAIHEATGLPAVRLVSGHVTEPSGLCLFGAAPLEGRKRVLGLLDGAAGGSVLVEHIGRLGMEAQERLLELIETDAVRRLGDNERSRCEARLILLDPMPLPEMLARGVLHPALAARLMPGHLPLPRLQDRLEDMPLLVEHFLERMGHGGGCPSVDHSAFRVLLSHDWPANVRELRTVVESAAMACEEGCIRAEHLPPLSHLAAREHRADDERDWILDALQRHRFRRGETAHFLGVSRKTLYNKLRLYGILT